MISDLYVDVTHLYPAINQLIKMGYTESSALHALSMKRSGHCIDELPERISLTEYVQAITTAREISGDPLFCIKAGLLESAGDFSPLARMASLCRDLKQVLELYCHYLPAWNPGFPTYLEEQGDVIKTPVINQFFTVAESEALMEYRIASCVRMLRLISFNTQLDPIAYVDFCHAAAVNPEAYEDLLQTKVNFEKPYTSFAIHNDLLDTRIPSHDEAMLAQVLKKAENQRLSQRLDSEDLLMKIRALIRSGLARNYASLSCVSERLSMSTSSMKRYLNSEGTSFQILLDQERKAEIAHFLLNSKLSNKEIARRTGVSSVSSFTQVCKRLFGATPIDIRNGKVTIKNSLT